MTSSKFTSQVKLSMVICVFFLYYLFPSVLWGHIYFIGIVGHC